MTAVSVQAEFLRGVRFARLTSLILRAIKRGERRRNNHIAVMSRTEPASVLLMRENNRLIARLYQAADEELDLLDCE